MLSDGIEKIKGVGEKTTVLFHKAGIYTKEDLLLGFPISYIDYPPISCIADAREKEWMAFSVVLKEDFRGRPGTAKEILLARAFDSSGEITIQFFHAPYIRKTLKKGMHFVFYGQVKAFQGRYYIQQPKYFSIEDYKEKRKLLEAVYSSAKGIKNYLRRRAVREIFKEDFACSDVFSEEELARLSLPDKKESLRLLHFPENFQERERGRKRLAFEELFFYSLYLEKEEKEYKAEKEFSLYEEGEEKKFFSYFPFSLTASQKDCILEMNTELLKKQRIYRFIEGDVGSGKTVIAFYLIYLTINRGKQAAFMAPTEILARQHYENALKLFPDRIALLLGSTSQKEKKEIYKGVAKGEILAVFGTQSLIQEGLSFSRLESIVIDEQHRFGVKERLKLEKKGNCPHTLFLSATPIPRSLAKLLYGSMPLSVLKENIFFNENNYTRFFIIAPKMEISDKADKITLAISVRHEPGALYHVLGYFFYGGMNMTHLESRPLEGKPFEYFFHIDVMGSLKDPSNTRTLEGLSSMCSYFKILGNYESCGR